MFVSRVFLYFLPFFFVIKISRVDTDPTPHSYTRDCVVLLVLADTFKKKKQLYDVFLFSKAVSQRWHTNETINCNICLLRPSYVQIIICSLKYFFICNMLQYSIYGFSNASNVKKVFFFSDEVYPVFSYTSCSCWVE